MLLCLGILEFLLILDLCILLSYLILSYFVAIDQYQGEEHHSIQRMLPQPQSLGIKLSGDKN
jgi:hypothetical protein